jgi:hypothetical protein
VFIKGGGQAGIGVWDIVNFSGFLQCLGVFVNQYDLGAGVFFEGGDVHLCRPPARADDGDLHSVTHGSVFLKKFASRNHY